MPRFPGCENEETNREKKACADRKMLRYVYGNLNYPLNAKRRGIEGTVVVSFTIGADGKLKDIHIKDKIGHGFDEEALRILNKMKKEKVWIPGIDVNGKGADTKFNLPTRFRIN